ncbi:MAG: HAMP domain-containing histidine kinase [Candidatus Pacebacteria bacterium]|nr:HAMP domain-containing histidine kinase [Candidatus Paceibacterota bacterium]MCD8508204.1 HAMP domain-containing histidine kinase [Candidatus Paceibacterota bacterium]MCD8528163.1 HAMP domain-containing histidine kinase [Candidatus Paceibacterota bacterium]MCD8563433.1 HAMP domain-containing histidine kinase [Candidatus Paceibacterota bacterium]
MPTPRTHKELEEALAACQAHHQEKAEFISMMTHQLRTPLSGNKWALNMLLAEDVGPLTSEQRTILTRGLRATEEMILLLQDIIHAHKHDSWGLVYTHTPTSISSVVHAAVCHFEQDARVHDVEIVIEEPEHEADTLIIADEQKIRFVIQNLLENAIKYSKEQGHVQVSIHKENDHIVIHIADDGIGIPADALEHLGAKFFRAHNVLEKEGTGLGLFTAYKIIREHGGTITCESTEGQGTTFSITLPCTQPA